MKITHELAQSIVEETMKILGKNINIMDENGVIIGSGNKERLNQFHEGAARVIREKKKLAIYPQDTNHLAGAKPGINLPIEYNNKIIGVVGITGDPDEVSPFGEIIKMTVEMMLKQKFLLKELHLEQQAKENFVQDFISGRVGKDPDLFVIRGQIVGYNILLPRIVMVVNIYQFEKTVRESLRTFREKKEGELYLQRLKNSVLNILRNIFINTPQDIVSYVGGDRFVVLKTISIEDTDEILKKRLYKVATNIKDALSQELKFKVSIGIGEYHEGIKGINRSFEEAIQALNIGTKLEGPGGIYHINELGIYKILTEIKKETQYKMINKVFYPQKNGNKREIDKILIDTLQSFFDNNLSICKTAKALYIHRNTLLYRLKKIKELTGLDPKKFDDALYLRMALKMKTYQTLP